MSESIRESESVASIYEDPPARGSSSTMQVAQPDPLRPIVIAATFTADLLVGPLTFWTRKLEIPSEISIAPYAQVLQQLLDPTSDISRNHSGFNIVLLRLEDWIRDRAALSVADNIAHLRRSAAELYEAMHTMRLRTSAPTFVILCPNSPSLPSAYVAALDALQAELLEKLGAISGVQCLTGADITRVYPVAEQDDAEADGIGHIPFTTEYFVALATSIARSIAARVKPRYKVIAVDCDNTLWKGVCGEDGIAGIELTPAHLDLQQMLVEQAQSGVLVCLCSKNNPEDVKAVFRDRHDMLLRDEHIVSSRLNWEPKSANLRSLADELSLGIDSFIFIDDNPLECAEVGRHCPSVLTLQMPSDPAEVRRLLDHTWAFDRVEVTSEAKQRTMQYRQNKARFEALEQASDLKEFLASLELRVELQPMGPEHVTRVAELTQRTNQFNLTTIRRTAGDIEAALRARDVRGLVIHVSDRFGDYGLVGVLFLRYRDARLVVDTFLLSCRVLGRRVEHRVIEEVARMARAEGIGSIVLPYARTPRNLPAWNFLSRCFSRFSDEAITGGALPAACNFTVPVDDALALDDAGDIDMESVRDDKPAAVSAPAQPATAPWPSTISHLRSVPAILAEMRASLTSAPRARASGAVPRTPTEIAIARAWCEVLRLGDVSLSDRFFDVGGDSLTAVQVISRIGASLGRSVPLYLFLQNPTIEDIACKLTQAAGTPTGQGSSAIGSLEAPIAKRTTGSTAPVTVTQQRWWNYMQNHQEGRSERLVCLALRIRGPLDDQRLAASVAQVIRAHEPLRTRFVVESGVLLQRIDETSGGPMQVIDLSHLPPATAEPEALVRARQLVSERIDLATGPLFEARLFRLAPRDHILVLAGEHLVTDEVSNSIINRDIWTAYRQFAAPLPPRALQFADYACWQAQTHDAWVAEHLGYWRSRFADAPRIVAPLESSPSDPNDPAFSIAEFPLGAALDLRLNELARAEQTRLAVIVLSAFVVAGSRWCRQSDMVLGFVSNGRYRDELRDMVGFMADILYLRIRIQGEQNFVHVVQEVIRELGRAHEHHDLNRLRHLMPQLSSEIVFNWFATREPCAAGDIDGLDISYVPLDVPWPRKFLTVFKESEQGIILSITYESARFSRRSVDGFARRFIETADKLVSRPVEAMDALGLPE